LGRYDWPEEDIPLGALVEAGTRSADAREPALAYLVGVWQKELQQ